MTRPRFLLSPTWRDLLTMLVLSKLSKVQVRNKLRVRDKLRVRGKLRVRSQQQDLRLLAVRDPSVLGPSAVPRTGPPLIPRRIV